MFFALLCVCLVVAFWCGLDATLRVGVTKDGVAVETTVAASGTGYFEVDEAIAANQTDKLVNVAFTYADLKWLFILSDQNCSIETNATDHTGGQIFTITAGVPFFWQKDSGITNPITANVTKIYVTNTPAIESLYIAGMNDATP